MLEPLCLHLTNHLKLKKNAPIVFITQGVLSILPLHAAWRPVEEEKKAFIDDFTVSYTPSAYALSTSRHRKKRLDSQQPSLLAIVNPTADLAFASIEGERIGRFFDENRSWMIKGPEATPHNVLKAASTKTHLHFACHGFL